MRFESSLAGATGYLQKYSRPKELLQADLDVVEDRLRIPDNVTSQVFAMLRSQHKLVSTQPLERLTTLERETLRLFAGGKPYAQIAEARGNKTVTVRNTLYRIQGKLRIETKQKLVIWAVRQRAHGLRRGGRGPLAGAGSIMVSAMHTIVNELRCKLVEEAGDPTYAFTESRVGYRMPEGET